MVNLLVWRADTVPRFAKNQLNPVRVDLLEIPLKIVLPDPTFGEPAPIDMIIKAELLRPTAYRKKIAVRQRTNVARHSLWMGRVWKNSGNGKLASQISKLRVFDGGPPGNDRQVMGLADLSCQPDPFGERNNL